MADNAPSLEIINRTADLLHSAFWWHGDYREFFEERGVPSALIDKAYSEGKHKAQLCKAILKELGARGAEGLRFSWQIIDAATELTAPFHPDHCSEEVFKNNSARLRSALAGRSKQAEFTTEEKERAERERKVIQERETELEAIRVLFWTLLTDKSVTPSSRGYELERIVGRLCKAFGLKYEPPSSYPGQQIDGVITFEGKALVLETKVARRQGKLLGYFSPQRKNQNANCGNAWSFPFNGRIYEPGSR